MGRSKRKQRIFPQGTAFVAHSLEMRQSAAWRALPDNARRVLDRIEIEHMTHGGAENGELIIPYDQFAKAGIRRGSVAVAIRESAALGFIEVKASGYAHSNAPRRIPNKYRLTYVSGRGTSPNPTDDWRQIADEAQAQLALASAAGAKAPLPVASNVIRLPERKILGLKNEPNTGSKMSLMNSGSKAQN